jgi:hypothetical protein
LELECGMARCSGDAAEGEWEWEWEKRLVWVELLLLYRTRVATVALSDHCGLTSTLGLQSCMQTCPKGWFLLIPKAHPGLVLGLTFSCSTDARGEWEEKRENKEEGNEKSGGR